MRACFELHATTENVFGGPAHVGWAVAAVADGVGRGWKDADYYPPPPPPPTHTGT